MGNNFKVTISYASLRSIVMALFNQGEAMKSPILTFSHGNIGNDYQSLARDIDVVVADSEKQDEFVIIKASVLDEEAHRQNERRLNDRNVIHHWQEFCQRIAKKLRCYGMDTDVEASIDHLVKDVAALPSTDEIHKLLHSLWTKAAAGKNKKGSTYDKAEWGKLEDVLGRLARIQDRLAEK